LHCAHAKNRFGVAGGISAALFDIYARAAHTKHKALALETKEDQSV